MASYKRGEGYYLASDVAKILQVSRQRIHAMIRDGLLVPARSQGGVKLFDDRSVARYCRKQLARLDAKRAKIQANLDKMAERENMKYRVGA